MVVWIMLMAALIAALVAVVLVAVILQRRVAALRVASERVPSVVPVNEWSVKPRQRLKKLVRRMKALEADHDVVRAAVAEGIAHVERVESRIRATVRRAREELEERGLESPGLEAEAKELRIVDGSGSEAGELPPVPEEVGEPMSSIEGVTAAQLARARGR